MLKAHPVFQTCMKTLNDYTSISNQSQQPGGRSIRGAAAFLHSQRNSEVSMLCVLAQPLAICVLDIAFLQASLCGISPCP